MSNEGNHRESPECRRQRKEQNQLAFALQESVKEKIYYETQRQFTNLEELKKQVTSITLPENWSTLCKENYIIFFNLVLNPHPNIKTSVVVDKEKKLTVYIDNVNIKQLGNYNLPTLVTDTNKISDIIEEASKFDRNCEQSTTSNFLSLVKNVLVSLKSCMENKETLLDFFEEQISLLETKRPTYSSDMLVFSSLLYTISPHAYRFIRFSGNIVLPHPTTIHRVCSSYNFNPGEEQKNVNFLKYINYKAGHLQEHDKRVNLMVDEIYVKPFCDYTGGNIVGMAFDSTNMATSAHVFMISSITSSYKDVVHILPVKSITYVQLYDFMKRVIVTLEKLGFCVVSIITDNNAINRKAVSQFVSPPKLQIVYPHPTNKSRPLFYVIDPVHLLKSVRNNWLNQKNVEKAMYFPNFPNFTNDNVNHFQTASLLSLKNLLCCESNSLLKFGYMLSLKSLSPSNLERQNVNLVLKIFNEYVPQALLELGPKNDIPNFRGTAAFINIIHTWWSIMNVKTPGKGIRLNDVYKYPLTNCESDVKLLFLNHFLDWLDRWKNMNGDTGALTKETHSAMKHTTYAITEIVSYYQAELALDYMLPGKFQTDQLENRFSLYRQLAGGQYHVSTRQIFEIEKKLRMQSCFKIYLKTRDGVINVTDFNVNTDFEKIDENLNFGLNLPVTISSSDLDKAVDKLPVIVYIGGYAVYSVLKKLNCENCRHNLTIEKGDISSQNEVVKFTINLDRGQLMIPSPKVTEIVLYTFAVVSKLCFEHEETFLQVNNQKHFATSITLNVLENEEICLNDCDSNDHKAQKTTKMIIWSVVNILLNNYCKQRNDSEKARSSKKRKLQVFSCSQGK